jgi:predicted RecA/RadA family phage recombinase
MAKNYIQPGRVLTVPAPTGGAVSGAPILIGSLFGVAQHDAAQGQDLEILTEEVVELAKATPLAIDLGDRLFWNAGDGVLDKTATAQVCVGVAVLPAASADTVVRVKLGAVTPAGT